MKDAYSEQNYLLKLMLKHVLFVCKSCNSSTQEDKDPTDGSLLLNQLLDMYQNWSRQSELEIQAVGCLCTCERPCVVALSGANKPTYLFVDLPFQESAAELLQLGELYIDSDDGFVPRYKLPEILQPCRLARIPPLPQG